MCRSVPKPSRDGTRRAKLAGAPRAFLMATPAETVDPRRVLARHGLAAKKSWGQNFLRDRSVLARIAPAARAGADDVVVEVAAGLGALTAGPAGVGAPPARVVAPGRDPAMMGVPAAGART